MKQKVHFQKPLVAPVNLLEQTWVEHPVALSEQVQLQFSSRYGMVKKFKCIQLLYYFYAMLSVKGFLDRLINQDGAIFSHWILFVPYHYAVALMFEDTHEEKMPVLSPLINQSIHIYISSIATNTIHI